MPSVSNAENGTTWTPNSQVHVVIFENRWLSVDDMKSHASKIGHQPNSDVIRKFPTPAKPPGHTVSDSSFVLPLWQPFEVALLEP